MPTFSPGFSVVLGISAAGSVVSGAVKPDQVTSLPGLTGSVGVQFAGYASVLGPQRPEASEELFYWFHGSSWVDYRARPTILWTNGGPGSSSFWGFFLENGPFEISGTKASPILRRRPHAWTDFANFLIFEHPLSVTLSFPEDDKDVPRDVFVGIDHLYQALLCFLAKHPEIAQTPLILAGESYAGTYLPLLAQLIHAGNAHPGGIVVNLRAIVLVDAWVNPALQMASDTAYAVKHGIISAAQKLELDSKFAADLKDISLAIGDLSGLYLLNTALQGDPPVQLVLDYINRDDVRTAIHAKKGTPVNGLMSNAIYKVYRPYDDIQPVVQKLLDENQQIIVVSGLNDATDCNFIGTGKWLSLLNGSVAARFHAAETKQWRGGFPQRVLGYVQDSKSRGLSWVKVLNAGHLAVRDQPLLIDLIWELMGYPLQAEVKFI